MSFQSSYSENGKILLSFGGVSDEKLIDIPKAIDLAKNFGNIILMDPANKLKKYSTKTGYKRGAKNFIKEVIQKLSKK